MVLRNAFGAPWYGQRFENATMCCMSEQKTYSTLEAAKKAGIHRATLIRWLQEGHVKSSTEVPLAGGNVLRRFTDEDIEKIKLYRNAHYWEMPGAKRFKKSK